MIRVVPSGLPYWSRDNTFVSYGGDAAKADYASVPALAGDNDLSAADFNRLATDLAACARSAVFCVLQFTGRDSTAEDPLVDYVALPTGVYLGEPYDGGNPPSGFPGVVRNSTGNHTITLASEYSDAYGVPASVTVHGAMATVSDLGGAIVTAEITSSSSVTTEVSAGPVLPDKQVAVEIWVI